MKSARNLLKRTILAVTVVISTITVPPSADAFPVVVTSASGDILQVVKTVLDQLYQIEDMYLKYEEADRAIARQVRRVNDTMEAINRIKSGANGGLFLRSEVWGEINQLANNLNDDALWNFDMSGWRKRSSFRFGVSPIRAQRQYYNLTDVFKDIDENFNGASALDPIMEYELIHKNYNNYLQNERDAIKRKTRQMERLEERLTGADGDDAEVRIAQASAEANIRTVEATMSIHQVMVKAEQERLEEKQRKLREDTQLALANSNPDAQERQTRAHGRNVGASAASRTHIQSSMGLSAAKHPDGKYLQSNRPTQEQRNVAYETVRGEMDTRFRE